MSRFRAPSVFAAILLTGIATVIACVGSDPTPPLGPGLDGGSTSSSSGNTTTSSSSGNPIGIEDGGTPDSYVPPTSCDPSKPFPPVTPFEEVNSNGADEGELRFSPDGELAYYARGAFTDNLSDIWVATRAGAFKDGFKLPGVNPDDGCCFEGFPTLSPNGLEIVFQSNQDGVNVQTYRATRKSTSENFSGRAAIASLGTAGRMPFLTYDGTALYYVDFNDSQAIKRSSRVGDTYAAGVLAVPNGTIPMVTGDERTLYFYRSGKVNMAERVEGTETWVEKGVVPGLPSKEPSWVSADGCTMVFTDVGTLDAGAGLVSTNVWRTTKPK